MAEPLRELAAALSLEQAKARREDSFQTESMSRFIF